MDASFSVSTGRLTPAPAPAVVSAVPHDVDRSPGSGLARDRDTWLRSEGIGAYVLPRAADLESRSVHPYRTAQRCGQIPQPLIPSHSLGGPATRSLGLPLVGDTLRRAVSPRSKTLRPLPHHLAHARADRAPDCERSSGAGPAPQGRLFLGTR